MDLPVIVHAEAVLWSRSTEAGFTSILDPQAQMMAQNLKKFYADPAKVKAAVDLLKKHGFSVYSVGKTSISIGARPEVFETAFPTIKLVGTDVGLDSDGIPVIAVAVSEANQPSSDIPSASQPVIQIKTEGGAFQALLAGIILSQPEQPDVESDPPLKSQDTIQLYPSDLPRELGWGGVNNQEHNGAGVEVIIIDTGCYTEHPYFRDKDIDVVIPKDITQHQMKLKKELEVELEKFMAKTDEYEQDYINCNKGAAIRTELFELWQDHAFSALVIFEDIFTVMESMDKEKDRRGHGTAMVASTLAIAPKAKITVIKKDRLIGNSTITALNWLKKNRKKRNVVVSCSWSPSNYDKNQQVYAKIGEFIISSTLQRMQIFCFSVGNKGKTNSRNTVSPYVRILGVLGVGGANRDSGELSASDISLASIADTENRSLPDICGWCGSSDRSWLIVPVSPESLSNNENLRDSHSGWRQITGGTSSATAQIAGVCALIKAKWLDAGWFQILALLLMNADPLTDQSRFATGFLPSQVGYVGMVNIQRTLEATMKKVKDETAK